MADSESSSKKRRGFGFIVKILAAVAIVLAVVRDRGRRRDSRSTVVPLEGRWSGIARYLSGRELSSLTILLLRWAGRSSAGLVVAARFQDQVSDQLRGMAVGDERMRAPALLSRCRPAASSGPLIG
jgi:hypothetical protein